MRVSQTLKVVISAIGLLLVFSVILVLAGCQPTAPSPTVPRTSATALATPVQVAIESVTPQKTRTPTRPATPTTPTTPVPTVPEPTPTRPVTAVYGYTHQQPDGNRLMAGRGSLPDAEPMDIPLAGQPRWLAAAPAGEGSVWVVVLDDGRVQGFRIAGEAAEATAIEPNQLPPGMPPLLQVKDGAPSLVVAPTSAASPLTHSVVLNEAGRLAYIEGKGDLVVWDDGEVARLALNVLPDARLLVDEAQRLLLLADATTRYDHGVLGDAVEAASITLVETLPQPRVALTIPIPGQMVVEGIAPIWADLDGDGVREIIVTLSDANQGAQVVVFNAAGRRIAAGPAIGLGRRWRHQLAVAPFGPAGELELADVLTPHIGGVVEFYRLEGDRLRIAAQVHGYTSHVIGTRNPSTCSGRCLDMAVAGDFDGDGRVELLLPDQGRTQLGGIRRTVDGAVVAWTVPAGGRITTNLAAVTLADGRLMAGAGREDGVLRLWLPVQIHIAAKRRLCTP